MTREGTRRDRKRKGGRGDDNVRYGKRARIQLQGIASGRSSAVRDGLQLMDLQSEKAVPDRCGLGLCHCENSASLRMHMLCSKHLSMAQTLESQIVLVSNHSITNF